jgi:hypothetical protein
MEDAKKLLQKLKDEPNEEAREKLLVKEMNELKDRAVAFYEKEAKKKR